MKLNQPNATFFVPDGQPEPGAAARTTHLGVGAHQDDLEFMALHGILAGYDRDDQWFGGITCTDGGGSSRSGPYASFTDAEMQAVRVKEQNAAAALGQYSFMAQLGYPSAEVKDPARTSLDEDLLRLFATARPDVVYTHNPADKHETHIAVLGAALRALRALPPGERPRQLLGCEVWRDLDWMPDDAKVVLDVSGHHELATSLAAVFDSQIAGGKRYDLAVEGRRRTNATFLNAHAGDRVEEAWFAMDLSPLIQDDTLDPNAYVQSFIQQFAEDVAAKLNRHVKR